MELTENVINTEFENTNSPQPEVAPEADARPAITDEQYAQMAEINARIRDLKQFGFDLREHIDGMRSEIERLEGELEKARTELVERTKDMQTCYDDFILAPYNITGQIAISDSSPHYITVMEAPAQGQG